MKWFLNIFRNTIGPGKGVIWILQGVNILGGSSMSGQEFDTSGLGTGAALIGAGLLFLGYRRRKIRSGR